MLQSNTEASWTEGFFYIYLSAVYLTLLAKALGDGLQQFKPWIGQQNNDQNSKAANSNIKMLKY